ncbi:unnamed protein product [Ambrosiozyma monospora]|uniref:Unnamed protein product n=1 Tax=Ambrosiozyma monospora TaxID=43982 RepID=A0ACB5TB55_AMBMO|nr:unnamed protein product [Ambrosiozyma monospora]
MPNPSRLSLKEQQKIDAMVINRVYKVDTRPNELKIPFEEIKIQIQTYSRLQNAISHVFKLAKIQANFARCYIHSVFSFPTWWYYFVDEIDKEGPKETWMAMLHHI